MSDNTQNIIIYQTDDGAVKVDVRMQDDTVWLSLDLMAELFQRDKSTISRHIKNIFSEGELLPDSVVANFATTAVDGKTYKVEYSNLDVIISVGYRVKSQRGTQFRIWATKRLNEYIRKGFALDDNRLKNLGGGGYWKELMSASETSARPKRCFTDRFWTFTPQASTTTRKPTFPLSFSKGCRTRFIMRFTVRRQPKSLSVAPMPKKNLWA